MCFQEDTFSPVLSFLPVGGMQRRANAPVTMPGRRYVVGRMRGRGVSSTTSGIEYCLKIGAFTFVRCETNAPPTADWRGVSVETLKLPELWLSRDPQSDLRVAAVVALAALQQQRLRADTPDIKDSAPS